MLLQNQNNILEFIKRAVTGLILSLIIFYNLIYFPKIFSIIIIIFFLIILKFEWALIYKNIFKNIKYNFIKYKFIFYLTTLIYLIIPFLLILYFEQINYKLNLYLFLLSFIHDTASYIFGKLFGINKLCPKISPSKTIQGALAGFLAIFFTILLFNKLNIFNLIFSIILTLGFLTSDLFESYLKRLANIKDSGSILPGHGGDRKSVV